jgi:2-dehydropantoate 2-reductase
MWGHIGEVNAAPGGTNFIRRFLNEVVAVVTAEGHPPSETFLTNARQLLTAPDSTQTSSMFRDTQRGVRSRLTRSLVIFSRAASLRAFRRRMRI